MNTQTYAVKDSMTMLRRNLRRQLRDPTMIFFVIGIPVVLLLLFVYAFGGTLGAGLGGSGLNVPSGDRGDYLDYVAPGILMLGIAGGAQGTAISIAMDTTQGIVARFRTMAIFRPSILVGHVVGSVLQTMLALVVVLGVALALGFRPNANALEWLATAGLLALTSLALTWLSLALGLVSKSVESASNIPMPLLLLPFLGSAFVPTDSMPTVLQWFAEYQPFTPLIETVRGLLMGTEIGSSAIQGVAWCVGITVVGYVWAKHLFNREPAAA